MNKRGLVISGGGAKGAYAGGIIEYLIKIKKIDWSTYVSTSTGSLISPLASIGKIDELKKQYTSVTNKDIFSKNPFKRDGSLKLFNALWRIIRGKTSLGEANNLKKRLDTIFSEDDYIESIKQGKDLFVTVSNFTTGLIEFKRQKDNSYSDFKDWIIASASVPAAFEIVKKNGYEYLDGGVIDSVPIQKAIDEKCSEIDVIVLRPHTREPGEWKSKNILDLFLRTIDIMNMEISNDDVIVGQLRGQLEEITLNFYYTPYSLTNNSIMFDKKQMTEWWDLGYNYAMRKKNHILHLKKSTNKDGIIKYAKIGKPQKNQV